MAVETLRVRRFLGQQGIERDAAQHTVGHDDDIFGEHAGHGGHELAVQFGGRGGVSGGCFFQ